MENWLGYRAKVAAGNERNLHLREPARGTFRKKAGVGLGGAPLMEMSLLILMRPRWGQPEMATESTPGAARSASVV
jgi:hypothetical protein